METAQGAFQQALEQLAQSQTALAQELTTTRAGLAQAQAELKAQASTAAALESSLELARQELIAARRELSLTSAQFSDLKSSFLLIRDDLSANTEDVRRRQAARTRNDTMARLGLVADLYLILLGANSSAEARATWAPGETLSTLQ
jgi:chromosome segregation ATPase